MPRQPGLGSANQKIGMGMALGPGDYGRGSGGIVVDATFDMLIGIKDDVSKVVSMAETGGACGLLSGTHKPGHQPHDPDKMRNSNVNNAPQHIELYNRNVVQKIIAADGDNLVIHPALFMTTGAIEAPGAVELKAGSARKSSSHEFLDTAP